MNEHLGSINPLATASYGYTHCIVLETAHCGSVFFIQKSLEVATDTVKAYSDEGNVRSTLELG